jgi:hypothetical protein
MSRIAGLLSTLLFTLILAGCNTLTVDISVPDVITQHEPFTYEAEADPAAVGQIAYEWSLDGTIISSLPIDNALIATAGEHTLSVKITDEEGETGEAEVTLDVLPAEILNADFAVNVELLDMEEAPLENVTVTIDGVTVESDAQGIAAFTGLTQTPVLTVAANKEGYIPQSYRFDLASAQESADIQLTLMERASPVVFNNDAEVILENSDLNTSVTLPAGAFVNANGDPVTGEITATITPVDTREMGASYLGGGVALTEESEVVQLLSLGMIDFEFTQNGEAVQLAAEASAQIEMDLVAETGPDGRVYTIGEEIEMWWFDEATGLWVEEGVGEIVASATSPTGMRLIATVEHFTTWNWDYYKAEDRASITLNCLINGSQMGPLDNCNVSLSADGIYRSTSVGRDGVTIVNVAPGIELTAKARVRAINGDLYTGRTSFTTVPGNNSVNLDLGYTGEGNAFISCTVTDGATVRPVECFGSTVRDDGGHSTLLNSNSSNSPVRVPIVQGEPVNLLISLQGNIVTDTINVAGAPTVIVKEYEVETTLGQLSCYATLDGGQGEYYPCTALVTSDSGINTVVRAGDYSGTPLTAPISYSNSANSLDIAVASAFNDGELYNDLYSEPEYFYFSPFRGQHFTLPTSEPVTLEITDNIESRNLYTYTCRLDGEVISAEICNVTYHDFETEERWRTTPHAPSWMNGKMHLPISNITPAFFDGDIENDSPVYGYYVVENVELNTSNRTIVLDMIFNVPQ